MKTSSRARTTIRLALTLATAVALGACAPISQRALANGRITDGGRAYNAVMNGNMSMEAHRALVSSYSAFPWVSHERAYAPFGSWWY